MQPPRQESNAEQDAQAPPLCGLRSSGTVPIPARRWRIRRASGHCRPGSDSWMANGQAYTSPTGSIRQTTRPAPHRFSPGNDSPNAARWKKESPVSTFSPLRTSQSYSCAAAPRCGCSSSQTSAPRPDGRSRVSRSCALYRSAMALNASSCSMFCRVQTTEILKPVKPASARFSMRRDRGVEGALAPDVVVDLGGGAVERDLHVDVVAGGQPSRGGRRDLDAVGGELHPHLVGRGVVDQFPEVRPDGRFAAADVHVEHLHALEFVDDRLAPRRS